MTYLESETSAHGGKPVELYRYAGTYETFRYTSAPKVISFQAPDEAEPFDYQPLAMKRSEVKHITQDDDGGEVTIEMPVTTDIISIYGFQISPPELYLTVYRTHNPGEYVSYWQGHVENISVTKGMATIRVPSQFAAALSADFPNVYYQSPCNHTLYDARCGVDENLWNFATQITAMNGQEITVAGVGDLAGQLIGGDLVLNSGERRMIVSENGSSVDGERVMVNYPFAGANVGDGVKLSAGCDLSWSGDCDTRFNNTERFGGFPFIPNVNIFNTGLEPGKNLADGEPCLPGCGTDGIIRFRFQQLPGPTGRLGGQIYWLVKSGVGEDYQPVPDGGICNSYAEWYLPLPEGETDTPADFYNIRQQGANGSCPVIPGSGGDAGGGRLLVRKPGWNVWRAVPGQPGTEGLLQWYDLPDPGSGIGYYEVSGWPVTLWFALPPPGTAGYCAYTEPYEG